MSEEITIILATMEDWYRWYVPRGRLWTLCSA